jgi:putative phosphoribosyl transferase
MTHRFRDRRDAGRQLGRYLLRLSLERPLVLALPRGGVPVAFEVASALRAPLDVFIVRKLGVPGHEELAMGAIASGGNVVVNPDVLEALNISQQTLQQVARQEAEEVLRRERAFRRDRAPQPVRGRSVVLVDDGLATGATIRAAVAALQKDLPSRLIVAVPVGSPEACRELSHSVDEVICPVMPKKFHAVGSWYDDFEQTSDDEVRSLLEQARQPAPEPSQPLRNLH